MCTCLLTSSAWLCISSSSHAHSHSRTGCATCVIYVHIYFYCRALLSGCKVFCDAGRHTVFMRPWFWKYFQNRRNFWKTKESASRSLKTSPSGSLALASTSGGGGVECGVGGEFIFLIWNFQKCRKFPSFGVIQVFSPYEGNLYGLKEKKENPEI